MLSTLPALATIRQWRLPRAFPPPLARFYHSPTLFLTVQKFACKFCTVTLFPDSGWLLGESGQNMVALWVGKGTQIVAEAGECASDSGATRCGPVVLPDLQGKGQVRQLSLFADLISGCFVSKHTAKPS